MGDKYKVALTTQEENTSNQSHDYERWQISGKELNDASETQDYEKLRIKSSKVPKRKHEPTQGNHSEWVPEIQREGGLSGKRCVAFCLVVFVLLAIIGITIFLLFHFKVIDHTDTNISPEGDWSLWEEWSTCSTTCGPGKHSRQRKCLQANCIGIKAEEEMCFAEDCPRIAESYGVWTTWGPWNSCDKTCGNSTQTRTRICKQDPGQYPCVGNMTHTRHCNNGICPDCNIACSGSNFQCISCQCEDNVVTGKVLTTQGVPIAYVQISHEGYKHTPIGMTNRDGVFSLTSMCTGNFLLFSKEGFIDTTIAINSTNNKIRLTLYEPLYIAHEPKSRSSLTGDCVKLNCKADGNPAPSYYEWFKDDMLVTEHDGNGELLIQNVDTTDAGSYKCRASNDNSAVFSRGVKLTVEDVISEICDSAPHSRVIDMPYGCEFNGSRQVDIGTCANVRCALVDNTTCNSNVTARCGVIKYERQIRQCDGYQIPLDIAVQCGCVRQEEQNKILNGVVLDSQDKMPVFFARVMLNDKQGQVTDASGKFSVVLPEGVTRVLITILRDQFTDFSAVVTIHEDIYLYHRRFYLKKTTEPMLIDAADDNTIPIVSNVTDDVYSTINIPKDSFVNEEGESYRDEALVFVDNYDTRDTFTILDAPGDFTAIDIEGETQNLLSAGMFRMEFTDLAGNKLSVRNNIDISLRLNDTQNISDKLLTEMKFWTLDAQGRWRFLSNMRINKRSRNKRQSNGNTPWDVELDAYNISGPATGYQWLNFDLPWLTMCFSKVELFEDTISRSEIQNPTVLVVNFVGSDEVINSVSETSISARTGLCITHPCDTGRDPDVGYRGYIIARDEDGNDLMPYLDDKVKDDLDLKIVEENYIETDLNSQRLDHGPVYHTERQCRNAPQSDDAFRFYRTISTECMDNSKPDIPVAFDINDQDVRKYFYSSLRKDNQIQACYMRIRIPGSIRANAIINVNNYIENAAISPTNWYGLHQKCARSEFTCIEYKVPGAVYHKTTGWTDKESTQIVISLTNRTNTEAKLKSLSDDEFDEDDLVHQVTVHLQPGNDAHDRGLFCGIVDFKGTDSTTEMNKINYAKKLALDKCNSHPHDEDWTVSFNLK